MLFKNKLKIEDRDYLKNYIDSFLYRTSGMTFTSLYMWRNVNEFTWEKLGDYVCISGTDYLEENSVPFMFFPLTSTGEYTEEKVRESIDLARGIFEDKGYPLTIMLMPKHLRQYMEGAFGKQITYLEDRDNFDYLYLKNNMIELKGRSLHKKKNHLNFFLKNYEYEYENMKSSMSDEIMKFIDIFNSKKKIPQNERRLLDMESKAMEEIFKNIDDLEDYYGGIVKINGKIEAISVGGRVTKDTLVVHIEKGNTEYRGLYPLMCHEFCKHIPEDIQYVNREEDMGIPNLRKAKLAYKPIDLIEKYMVFFEKDTHRVKKLYPSLIEKELSI